MLPSRPSFLARFASIALLCAPACSAPAPIEGSVPLPEYPPPAPARTASPDAPPIEHLGPILLEGTVWSGADSDGDVYTFEFRPGGKLHYTSPTGSWDAATWEQHGNRVTMEMNGHYAEYEGVIRGRRMEGHAGNKTGLKWTWKAEKQ